MTGEAEAMWFLELRLFFENNISHFIMERNQDLIPDDLLAELDEIIDKKEKSNETF